MKVAVFHPRSQYASWNMSGGIVEVLGRMGHQATGFHLPAVKELPRYMFEKLQNRLPTAEGLKKFDLILLSGLEHIVHILDLLYGLYEWKHTVTVPKAAWYHESFTRPDVMIDFHPLRPWADDHFFPACQDAEMFDQEAFEAQGHSHWLPLGVDTEVFRPCVENGCELPSPHGHWFENLKTYDCAFIGLLYGPRQQYVQKLSAHLKDVELHYGQVGVYDISGVLEKRTAELLADNYRKIKVFLNLPSLSKLLVSKVYEVMACGTFLLTPALEGTEPQRRNMNLFQSGEHCIFYRATNLPYINQLLRDYSSAEKDDEREKIARAGCELVQREHSLEKRLALMMEKVGNKVESVS